MPKQVWKSTRKSNLSFEIKCQNCGHIVTRLFLEFASSDDPWELNFLSWQQQQRRNSWEVKKRKTQKRKNITWNEENETDVAMFWFQRPFYLDQHQKKKKKHCKSVKVPGYHNTNFYFSPSFCLLCLFFPFAFLSFGPDIPLKKCLKGLKSQKSLFVSNL